MIVLYMYSSVRYLVIPTNYAKNWMHLAPKNRYDWLGIRMCRVDKIVYDDDELRLSLRKEIEA